MIRLVVVYQFFGPYHRARWPVLRDRGSQAGVDIVGLELFRSPDLYNWLHDAQPLPGVTRLELPTNGQDEIRWCDARPLTAAVRALKPDVLFVNGWGTRDALAVHAWCASRGIARVVVSDSQAAESRGRMRDLVKRTVVRGCAAAFVAGSPHRRYLTHLGMSPEDIFEGCDVVENSHFAKAMELRISGGRRLVTVARLAPSKNLLAAGEAFLEFLGRRSPGEDWCWQIVGYGPLQAELQALAARSDGHIRLLGPIDYDALPATLGEADLYWQPSTREPWGLAVNEAMASGLPVLVSDRCGCSEDLVTRETGWTFDPFDKASMVAALEHAAVQHGRWTEMGLAALRQIAHWDLDRFADGALKAAKHAVSPRRTPRM